MSTWVHWTCNYIHNCHFAPIETGKFTLKFYMRIHQRVESCICMSFFSKAVQLSRQHICQSLNKTSFLPSAKNSHNLLSRLLYGSNYHDTHMQMVLDNSFATPGTVQEKEGRGRKQRQQLDITPGLRQKLKLLRWSQETQGFPSAMQFSGVCLLILYAGVTVQSNWSLCSCEG